MKQCLGDWVLWLCTVKAYRKELKVTFGNWIQNRRFSWVWVWVWVLCYDRRSAGQSVLEYSTHLGLTTRSLLLVWQLRSCSCGAPSLTRGRVCLLYMLLALASAVFLWSESLGTRDHILLSQIWDFPFRHLLRLAGLRWRYSIPPPHGEAVLRSCQSSYILVVSRENLQHRKH
jgi:hypothetical protein